MPIYVYYCVSCEEFWDEILPMPGPPWIECPKCGDRAYKQVSAHGGYTINGDNSASTKPGSKE